MLKPLVAVVDDDPATLEFLDSVLTDAGWHVLTAQTERAAYALIVEQPPDLIILDIRMDHPRAGWVLLDLLRAYHRTKATPIIVCSGDQAFLREKANRLKAKGCQILVKPFTLTQLIEMTSPARLQDIALGR
jgi:adenylate cyclase